MYDIPPQMEMECRLIMNETSGNNKNKNIYDKKYRLYSVINTIKYDIFDYDYQQVAANRSSRPALLDLYNDNNEIIFESVKFNVVIIIVSIESFIICCQMNQSALGDQSI